MPWLKATKISISEMNLTVPFFKCATIALVTKWAMEWKVQVFFFRIFFSLFHGKLSSTLAKSWELPSRLVSWSWPKGPEHSEKFTFRVFFCYVITIFMVDHTIKSVIKQEYRTKLLAKVYFTKQELFRITSSNLTHWKTFYQLPVLFKK